MVVENFKLYQNTELLFSKDDPIVMKNFKNKF